MNLIAIRDELKGRNARVDREHHDVTHLFRDTKSTILKKAKQIIAIRLNRICRPRRTGNTAWPEVRD